MVRTLVSLGVLVVGATVAGALCFVMGVPAGVALGVAAGLILGVVLGGISLALHPIDLKKRHLNLARDATILSRPDRQRRDRVITSPKGEPS